MASRDVLGPTCPTPVDRAAMVQHWEELTFVHWRYPADVVQKVLPAGLEVETFDGSAWIGLIPFSMRVRLPGTPSVPWMSEFPETNVRTYVSGPDGESGIWFFSLDAARLGAVVTARTTYRLPYFWSRMRVAGSGAGRTRTYHCRRRWPGPWSASSLVVTAVGDPYDPGDLHELDHFLTARWSLFSDPRSGLRHARAWHEPWPLHRAHLLHIDDHLVEAAGLPPPSGETLVHFSPGVEVRIGWPHPATG
ncbi:MAG: uncharacterized protein QOD63_2612 [Actinomycetota bacterium]|jgi:uncharacterized protein YqjF (DUF2071 family)|nr:uncharacterized protein [Actinomycetota bacterium]